MNRLHDCLPMQLRERFFDEDTRDSESSASVRSCRNGNPPAFDLLLTIGNA